jgi:hypothetical protein
MKIGNHISAKKFRPFVIACFCKREQSERLGRAMMKFNVNTLHIIFGISEKVNILLYSKVVWQLGKIGRTCTQIVGEYTTEA